MKEPEVVRAWSKDLKELIKDILYRCQPMVAFLHDEEGYTWSQISDICVMTSNRLLKLRKFNGTNWDPRYGTVSKCDERLVDFMKSHRIFKKYEDWYAKNSGIVKSETKE